MEINHIYIYMYMVYFMAADVRYLILVSHFPIGET